MGSVSSGRCGNFLSLCYSARAEIGGIWAEHMAWACSLGFVRGCCRTRRSIEFKGDKTWGTSGISNMVQEF